MRWLATSCFDGTGQRKTLPSLVPLAAKAVSPAWFTAGAKAAHVTGERCTVLAEVAAPIADLDRTRIDAALKDAREDLADAKDEPGRKAAERRVAVEEAKLAALEPQPY